ncbi:hypothetical protein [Roseospira navarrensis]|uniref:Uncharacterized protein n=1 Tax=Roseospira navarrensis TaxID=140058 RepID=A0A7X1ZIJ7_9PROT|nr:hypothetical protein [Roseospira navarrensis]MQX37890.1 hypothetical protein [Roseospira navarrensis]
MPVEIQLHQNLDAVKREIADFSDRQVPFAIRLALNATAVDGRDRVRDEMTRVFDSPTRFTLNSLFVRFAGRDVPEASVNIKDFAPKGTPAFKYLAPQIAGGERRTKRFERALQAAGVLPSGMLAVPGSRADLDAHGNMKGGQITKILSSLRASSDPYQNRGAGPGRRTRRADRYFAGQFNGGPDGIWQVKNDHALPIMLFVDRARYRPRLHFAELVHDTVDTRFGDHFAAALRRAHATARD